MASRGDNTRVLRACVVQGGKVLEEQRLGVREPLSIGTAPGNTFIVPGLALPASYKLFEPKGAGYELVVTEEMFGMIATDGDPTPIDFSVLKSGGAMKKRGQGWALALTEAHRGKVVVGNLTIIFQFVVPPQKPAPVVLPEATRIAWRERIDMPLALCLAVVAVLETPLLIGLHLQPPPKEVTLENMDERWAQLIVPDRKPVEKKPVAEAQKAETKKAETKKAKADEPQNEAEKAKAKAQRTAEIRKSIGNRGILALLGTTGAGSGAIADVMGEGGLSGDLDSAFEGIAGVGLATGGQRTTRGAGAGEAASIGGLATAGGGAVGLGGKAETRVASVKTEAPEVDGSLDGDVVTKVVQSRIRMVRDCYERELKRVPTLAGKVEIEFTIGEDGSVEEARVASNSMGSDEVGQCIVSRIQRWKFPKPDGGSVTVSYPFIFAPSS